jgi:hypothetical protein
MTGLWENPNLMNKTESPIKSLLGAFLLTAAASSSAVSLGTMRGATVIGRTFDVSLTTQVNSSDGLATLCVAADVFFGDNQLPSNRVSISVDKGASAREALVRIRTNSTVDEPVVTVVVRSGCTQIYTRKYVLLAEILDDSTSQTPAIIGESMSSASVRIPSPITRDSDIDTTAAPSVPARSSQGTKAPMIQIARKAPRVERPSVRLAARAVLEPVATSPRARLKLDPLDLTAERDPVLRSSMEMLTAPSTDIQQRAAGAALWQAINAQPDDVLRGNQQLKSLEANVASLLAQDSKTQQVTLELRAQLEQARTQRYSNPLVYALVGLLTLTLLAAFFFWTRSRRKIEDLSDGQWWRKETESDDKLDGPASSSLNQDETTRNNKLGISDRATATSGATDLDLGEARVTEQKPSRASPAARPFKQLDPKDRSSFSPSLATLTGVTRIVNAEELFDVQEQADFFVSLGDFEKAVEVLRSHITGNVETSALAYLGLFEIYHSLGRKTDYELLSKEFKRTFNAQVPPFYDYSTDTHGLEFYTTALSRIQVLWPTPKVLDVIEESIFRKPDSGNEAFSLAAYRELLLLHAIVKEIIEQLAGLDDPGLSGAFTPPTPSDPKVFSSRAAEFTATNIKPLSADLDNYSIRHLFFEKQFDLTRPHSSPRIGVDIDLSLDFDDLSGSELIFKNDVPGSLAFERNNNLIEFHLDALVPSPTKNK